MTSRGGSGKHRAANAGTASDTDRYLPPWWLRNAHLQSVLGSSPLRQRRGARRLAATGALSVAHEVDGGGGIRLRGLLSTLPGRRARGLALLLHGWEGSAESSYMRLSAARLLPLGFDVFRLNFRDHGDTHALNPELFHSNRIDEVVHAAGDIVDRFRPAADAPVVAAGFSLGGNFALRLALRAPAAGVPLARAAAVCPVLDPASTMQAMEHGPAFYMRHFERRWRESLARKRTLFPQVHDFDDSTLKLRMRALTEWMVLRHTDFGSLDRYFDGYSIAGDRLLALQPDADILMSEDDPVIPVSGFRALALPPNARLEIAPWGGHCGFLEGAGMDGYAERWISTRLATALAAD